jgi:hypothetical protein
MFESGLNPKPSQAYSIILGDPHPAGNPGFPEF